MTDNNFIDDLSDQENDYLLEFHNNLLEIHELNGKQNNLSTNCENDNDSQTLFIDNLTPPTEPFIP